MEAVRARGSKPRIQADSRKANPCASTSVTYSADGRMSAHLMRPPDDPAEAPAQYLGYWGTFTVDASARTITHHVIKSDQRNWIGSDQVRGFEFVGGDRLILSLGSNRLTWVRAR